MKQIPIKLGPMALLLTVIAICLTVLALLTFSTAGADQAMADRYGDSVAVRYALDREGQAFLKEADDALAEGKGLDSLEGVKGKKGTYRKELTEGGYVLTIVLKDSEGKCKVEDWKLARSWEEKEQKSNLWLGQ